MGASLGAKGLIEAMNVAYGESEKRGFVQINLLAFGFTLGAAFLVVTAVATVVLVPAAASILPFEFVTWLLVRGLSFVVLAGLLVVALAALYRFGPSRKQAKWRWLTPGALFALLAVLLTSYAFSWYVENFGNYDATYGSLGAIIGLLTWLWISIMAVVIGAQFNAEIEHQSTIDTTTPPKRPIGKRGAHVADTIGD